MKTLVSIFVLFFSFEIYADVGDKYSCKTLETAKIGANGIEKYEKENFTFEWRQNNEIHFDSTSGFAGLTSEVLLGGKEIFYSINYQDKDRGITSFIINYQNGSFVLSGMSSFDGVIGVVATCNKF